MYKLYDHQAHDGPVRVTALQVHRREPHGPLFQASFPCILVRRHNVRKNWRHGRYDGHNIRGGCDTLRFLCCLWLPYRLSITYSVGQRFCVSPQALHMAKWQKLLSSFATSWQLKR